MFNPTPQRADPQAWAPNAVIQPVRQGVQGFETTDWENVPRVDYRTEKFRQLAVPDPARVVEDASEFEPWQPKTLSSTSAPTATEATPRDASTPSAFAGDSPADDESDALVHGDAAPTDAAATPDETQDSGARNEGASAQTAAEPDTTYGLADDASRDNSSEDRLRAESPDAPAGDGNPVTDDASHAQENPAAEGDASTATPESGASSPRGLDSATLQEACEAARQEGHEQGLEAGRTEAREQAQASAEAQLQAVREEAEQDKSQALQALREELEAELDPLKRQLSKTIEQVESLIGQPDKLYEHVKRLSLHLAEQIVIGELNMSSAAIERLIQRCLDELDLHGNHVVTVELNPQDKARLQERAGELTHTLSLQAVHTLQPGSVRVVVNDTMVEDLVGNRLDALARSLLVQPEAWREQSPFFRQPLAQRDAEVQDAPSRTVSARESTRRETVAPEPVTVHAEPPVVHAADTEVEPTETLDALADMPAPVEPMDIPEVALPEHPHESPKPGDPSHD